MSYPEGELTEGPYEIEATATGKFHVQLIVGEGKMLDLGVRDTWNEAISALRMAKSTMNGKD